MAKGKEFPLFVIMKAVDKATDPLRALGKTASNTAKPFQKLRELNNRIGWRRSRRLGKIPMQPKLVAQWRSPLKKRLC